MFNSYDAQEAPDATLAILTATYAKTGQLKKIREYVDVLTGEIFPASEFPTLTLGPRLINRSAVLSKLRPEVRAFAEFVLKFSNRRRGITPGVAELSRWYADITGKRLDNVKRYVAVLMQAKVLMNENLLGPLFQRTGGRPCDHLGEYQNATTLYLQMRHRDFDPINGKQKRTADPTAIAEEVSQADADLVADIALWKARTTMPCFA